jgi:ABC-2 type transport system ATP-binding protein
VADVSPKTMNVIDIQDLTRRYGARRGIEALTLAVPEGSLFGFLGPNGAGKTTTIRVLLGFLRPTSGSARILGRDCWRDTARIKADVGYLPGDLRLYPWMNGTGALRLISAARGRDLLGEGRALAERFALDLRVKVRSMSRGMRQKLGLLLALAHRPRLLVLDEPTASLDPLMQETLRHYLREQARNGTTVFFSSHTLSEVEQLCDRVAIVREGRLVADEPLDALRRRAGHEVTIRWRDAGHARTLAAPPFLTLLRREDSTWHGLLNGPVEDLLRWLAPQSVDDLTVRRPDLDTLFRRFYQREEASS